MKFSISTEVLKELVSRSVKGMGNNKVIPITGLMLIKLENNILTLVTTDSVNYLYVKKDKVDGDNFYVVVQGEQFSKLISKLTCDKTELEVSGNSLKVRGNGNYRIDIPLDEGEYIQYPDPMEGLELPEDNRNELHLSTIHSVLESCKSSLAVTLENPHFTGYYAGESVVTTNDYTMSSINVDLFGYEVLVPSEYMELLNVMTQEKFSSYVIDDKIICTSPDCVVYGVTMEGIEDFPIEGIRNYIAQEMESSCKINKVALLSVLDRISLFVGAYDDGAIRLTFTRDGLSIESRQSNGIETVPYMESNNYKPFTGMMDVKEFINAIKSDPDDDIKLQYGSERALKMTAGNISIVIAWIVEDDAEEE